MTREGLPDLPAQPRLTRVTHAGGGRGDVRGLPASRRNSG